MKKHIGSAWLIIATVLSAVIQFVPDAMQQAWMLLPDDLRASIPPLAVKWITYSLFTFTVLSKVAKNYSEKKQLKQELANVKYRTAISAVDLGGDSGSGRSAGVREAEENPGAAGRENGGGTA